MVTEPRRRQLEIVRFSILFAFIPVLVLIWRQPVQPGGRALVSLFYVSFFTFLAPVRCCARTVDRTICRNQASGLVFGCGMREHRLQRLRDLLGPTGIAGVLISLLEQNWAALAMAGLLLASLSTLAAAVQALLP